MNRPWASARAGKYNARKTAVNGMVFDSRAEAARYVVLREMERIGEIRNLRTQVEYLLVPKQPPRFKGDKGERPICYRADFVYESCGETVVEDVKGKITPEYVLKRKLMRWVHGVGVREVRDGRR